MIPKFFRMSFLCATSLLHGQLVQKFPVPVGVHGLYRPLGAFYIGAAQQQESNDLSVAVAGPTSTEFRGIAPDKVVLNNEIDSPNPLHGAAIDHMALLDRRPVVTPHLLPSSLFLIDDRRNPIAVFQSAALNDAQGRQASSLLALTTSAADVTASLDVGASLAAIAAVPNAQGGFDGDGSGIALAWFQQIMQGKEGQSFFAWDVVDAVTGKSSFMDGKLSTTGNRAASFSKDTPELFLGGPVSQLAPDVDLHFDRDLGRLYIATHVRAGGSSQAGARAVVVASIAQGKLRYHPIAPESAFNGADQIVGKRGIGSSTHTFKVRTLQTRTHLRYLIVVGGNGDDGSLDQKVYALPLVDNIASPEQHGTLASIKVPPVTLFGEHAPHRFRARVFAIPATKPDELYTMNSLPAMVGGQAVLPGTITELWIAGEAVCVSCVENNSTDRIAGGIFISQPVFDTLGRIQGWTDWCRAGNTSTSLRGFAYDAAHGIFWQLPETQGSTDEVLRNEWVDGNDPLSEFVMTYVSQEKGGIQGLQDIPYVTDGFTQDVDKRIAAQCYTAGAQVLFTQTGSQQNGLFKPYENFADTFVTVNGSFQGFQHASNLICSGGVLAELGPLCASAVLSDGITGWLVVGGVGGVAVLADDAGIGWDAQQGLQTRFAGLSQNASFKKISTTPFVRKLIVQDGQLFVLSLGKLERFTISADALASQRVESVVLAELTEDQKSSYASYSDLYITGPLALLATNFGLLRSGNGVDIRGVGQVPWVAVPLKESVGSLQSAGPVTRLYSIKTSQPFAPENLYVLNACVGLNQALIYRLVISLTAGQVTDTSVQLFPDYLVQDTNSFFVNCGDYQNYVVTDGSLIALSRSSFRGRPPFLQLLSPTLKSGENARARVPFLQLPERAETIGLLTRSSVSGAWVVPGDFGVRIQR
jgi:hypothetical protein